MKNELIRAIDLALDGSWEQAHNIVQQDESGVAAWIHAVLHKIEGDLSNSRYWYQRAGKMEKAAAEPRAELAEIKNQLAGDVG